MISRLHLQWNQTHIVTLYEQTVEVSFISSLIVKKF